MSIHVSEDTEYDMEYVEGQKRVEIFDRLYHDRAIPFIIPDPSWNLTRESTSADLIRPKQPGEMWRFITSKTSVHGRARKGILLRTDFGCITVIDRFNEGERHEYVSIWPNRLHILQMFFGAHVPLTAEVMERLLCNPMPFRELINLTIESIRDFM